MEARKAGRRAGIAAVLVAVATVAGCATGPSVRATTDPAADFATYHTYGFVERTGTDRGDYSTIVSRALKAAVAVEKAAASAGGAEAAAEAAVAVDALLQKAVSYCPEVRLSLFCFFLFLFLFLFLFI